ncbi:peptide/nickel transport system substrate-binding protein [Mesorhizobium loti]|uniref:Peptide/nickel transport system substrate-binding protein n=1 Tax=Rhizobium loti TaxID=381 RepID=A0A8E2W5G8_RHILI|nr:ABC transporter substrate-binding protein [Mesorhizobium loti]PWJ85134.1 peptide/nickel transport system substrate-binding protein [Mesorhizobium loti]
MTISRRNLFRAGIAAGAALSIPSVLRAQTVPVDARTVRMMNWGVPSVFDPVITTSQDTTDHAAAIYDTLFALDSKFVPQPQMVGKWGVSDDKKTYTFELRDGLGWHDGTPVTAADCVASIRRWAQIRPGGQFMMARVQDISKKDDKTFAIALKEPLGLLPSLLADILYIMREKNADTPATEAVTTNIGSGPFKFNESLFRPGASLTYDRNEQYVPRPEPADGLAGGKIVKVNRVILENIRDAQTAVAALQAGEIDLYTQPPADLFSVIESDPNLVLLPLYKHGHDFFLRINCLQKPFDNVKARQAMLHLVDQEAFLQVLSSDPKYTNTVTSWFGSGNLATNDENTGWFKKGGDPEKAKQLFNEAGYAGEKVVILQPTDWADGSNTSQILAGALRKIGINVELAASDWAGVSARRSKKEAVEEGGWSIFITSDTDFSRSQPMTVAHLSMNGEKAWYGWPQSEEYEALRAKWADLDAVDERKALARKMQAIAWDYVSEVLLGQFTAPIAHRKILTGIIGMPDILPLWNMEKA